MAVDFLLINASNYPVQPVFPYAFVQVSALARRQGLRVARCDLLGTDPGTWSDQMAALLQEHQPRMVGFHLRQADSQILDQYRPADGEPVETEYFPVDDTRALVAMSKALCSAPVVVGGFGFSLRSTAMLEFLGADYGVVGGPDAFFEAFDALATRDVTSAHEVANLVFRREGRVQQGPLVYFGPNPEPEYDDTIFSELTAFYDRHGVKLSSKGDRADADVAIEIHRGCPCRCYFCTEPHIKGRRIQTRPLDAIMADVAFVAERGIAVVWFICSELNMGGMAFPLELAERMRAFNDGREVPVLWRAYSMPKPGMSVENLTTLMTAGYLPGWNEFASFDDVNLRACRMPYRAKDAVAYFRVLSELMEDPEVYQGIKPNKFEMFLGNAFMTPDAVRTTLEVADREGFSRQHFYGDSANATRVYQLDDRLTAGSPESMFSIGRDGRLEAPDLLRPTFHYAPELLAALGSEEEVDSFIVWASQTLLTRNHQAGLDVLGFLMSRSTPARLAECVARYTLPGRLIAQRLQQERAQEADALLFRMWNSPDEVGSLWDEKITRSVRASAGRTLLSMLMRLAEEELLSVYAMWGLQDPEDRRTPFRIHRKLYQRFDSIEDLRRTVAWDCLAALALESLLFLNNVRLRPAYRAFFTERAPISVRSPVWHPSRTPASSGPPRTCPPPPERGS